MRDDIKRQKCKEHGITLIEVPEIGRRLKVKDVVPFLLSEFDKHNIAYPESAKSFQIDMKEFYAEYMNEKSTTGVDDLLSELDAMDFSGNNGVVIGDPINGKAFLAVSNDKGDSWTPIETIDKMMDGEAFFASSGSNIKLLGLKRGRKTLFVSGGIQSRFFYNGKAINLPFQSGRNSTGANGLALNPNQQQGIIIGGDFANDRRSDSAILLFSLNPKVTFSQPVTPPSGYKSAAVFLSKTYVLSCGTSGVDLSVDGGLNWKNISDIGFHVAVKSPDGKYAIMAGGNGRIAKVLF
mgnify:CR=1 FL=1